MATRTVTIYASGSACTNSMTPDTPNTTQTIIAVGDVNFGASMGHVQGFEKFIAPKEIFEKKVVSAILHVYARRKQVSFVETTAGDDLYAIERDWNPTTTTANNVPLAIKGIDVGARFLGKDFAWREFSLGEMVGAKAASFGVNFHNYFEYYTSNSDHKPYIVVTVEDTVGGYEIKQNWPKNGQFENPLNNCDLAWYLDPIPGTIEWNARAFDPPIWPQKKAIVSWAYNGTTKTATVTDGGWGFSIPKEQLPNPGNVSWSVQVTSINGFVQSSGQANFTTQDGTVRAEVTSPINAYIDGSKTVDLNWRWSIPTGTRPTRADFQVSGDGGMTWDDLGTVTNQNDLTYHTEPNELPAGKILWRVRGYNTNGTAGPWSTAAAVVVRRAPNTPLISGVTGNPKPAVSWQADGQQAYQLQIGPWDSGTVFGTEKTDQCPEFLPDGPAAVRLRVQNSFGMWSAWAETSVTIQNRPGADITARARAHRADIRLTWETQGEYPEYLIYRDGELIGVAAGKEYTDHAAIGKATYTVRGVNYDSTYTDSSPVTEILTIRSGLIALEGEWSWLPLKCLRGRYPQIKTSHEAEITYTQFSGRHLPVAEVSGHYTKQHTLEFTLRNREEKKSLAAMVGKQVVYKDFWGRLIVGIMENLDSISDWASDVSFTITEVDHGPVL